MSFTIHTTGPVALTAVGSPNVVTVIGGIRNLGSAMGSQIKGEPSSGEIKSRLMALYGQKPTFHFTAEDIEGALGAAGPTGLALSATQLLTLFGSKILPGGGIDTTNHVSLVGSLGLLYPKTLTCAHQGDASITYEAMLYSADGVAYPLALTTAAALPTLVNFKRWTLGSVTMGGISITQDMNVSVDFGVRCSGEGSTSNILDQVVRIDSIEPRITVSSSLNGQIISLAGVEGAFSIVLRDRLPGGGFGTSTITLAATAGLAMQETPFQAAGHKPGDISIVGHIYWDGTNDPITYTYAKGSESA